MYIDDTGCEPLRSRKKQRHMKVKSNQLQEVTSTSDTAIAQCRPTRQAKIQAIAKLRNFAAGSNSFNAKDDKFDGVSYSSHHQTNTS